MASVTVMADADATSASTTAAAADGPCPPPSRDVWRFGYGSNVGLRTLRTKKNLRPSRYLPGSIDGWELYFMPGLSPYVEPAWAAVRSARGRGGGDDGESSGDGAGDAARAVHGAAFRIPFEEAEALDRQERGYDVVPCRFVAYDGEVVEDVGLYVPKKRGPSSGGEEAVPSLRYLRLLRDGAREAPLRDDWIEHLDSVPHYVTPPEVRARTERWIADFRSGDGAAWTAEELSKFDGSDPAFPVHVSVMGYVVKTSPDQRVFPSWRGHCITRRNLLQFNGQSIDMNDIRHDQPGFRPLPKLSCCSDEEKEYLLQHLDSLLHRGGTIVAMLKDFVEDQDA